MSNRFANNNKRAELLPAVSGRETYGALLSTRRAALQLSIRELARRSDLDAGYLSKLERGLARPPQQIKRLDSLADALRLSAEERSLFCDLAWFENARLPTDLLENDVIRLLLPLITTTLREVVSRAGHQSAIDPESCANAGLTAVRHAICPRAGAYRRGASPELIRSIGDRLATILLEATEANCSVRTSAVNGASAADTATEEAQSKVDSGAKILADLSRESSDYCMRRNRDAKLLQTHFDNVVLTFPKVQKLVAELRERGARAVVFGGWARDLIASELLQRRIVPWDLDIVVDGLEPAALTALLGDLFDSVVSNNAFGGFVVRAGDLKLDVWSLDTTYTFVRRNQVPSFDALPGTTVFTVESVIFKPAQWWDAPSVVEDGLYSSLDSLTIDLQEGERPFPAFQAGRALQFAEKLGLRLSESVLAFLQQTIVSDVGAAQARRGILEFGNPLFRPKVLRNLSAVRRALAPARTRRHRSRS